MILAVLTAAVAGGAGSAAKGQEADLFDSREPLRVALEAPWSELTRRLEVGRTADGRLTYGGAGGEPTSLDVSILTRGKSRLEVCNFPQLTLEAAFDDIEGTLFAGQPVVHMTTQCQRARRYQDYLALEYLSYQAYRLLSEHSLGARMVEVEYRDSAGKRRTESSHAFLLEDLGLAAQRLGGEWLKPKSVDIEALMPESLALLGLFQYMIGNTDWSVRVGPAGEHCCHNIALFGSPGADSGIIPVPFDLDSTGLVNPDHAGPSENVATVSVRQRVYRGVCESNPGLPRAIERTRAVRPELVALFETSTLLGSRAKKGAIKYLQSYYDTVDDPKKLESRILDKCR